MATLGALRAKVTSRMAAEGDPYFSPAELDAAINAGRARFDSEHDWPWLQTVTEVAIAAGDSQFDAPADLRVTASLVISNRELDAGALVDVIRLQAGATGEPQVYHPGVAVLRFAPVAAQDYTATLVYFRHSPELVDASDEALCPDAYSEAIVEAAVSILSVRDQDERRRGGAEAMYGEWVKLAAKALGGKAGPRVPRLRTRDGAW